MRKQSQSAGIFSVALVVALFVLFASLRAAAEDDDPPGRVARLGYTHGPVSFQPAGTDDWVNAVVNRPITTGDKLWADGGARAELQIGSASIRMAGNTGFSFLNLTDNTTQIQLTAGTLRVRVKRLDENETFEVDTPNLAFSVLRPGVYRINVNENGDTTVVSVRGGEGEVTGGGSAYALHAQEVGTFTGTDELTANVDGSANNNDDFDAWCADRDRHEDRSTSARYVSPDVIGYEDLDDYGGWRPVPEYGTVWFPHTTIVGWAPYHYGHWAYVYPWGYTWIDDAPWGFAPFHYGRWINVDGVWGWVPCPPRASGVVYVRPVYAPALVAWVGGPHLAVGVGVGWFPLGPREVYVPSYPVSRTYVTNVNVSNTTVSTTVINNYYNTTVTNRNTTVTNNNVTVVHQTYVNQSVPGAVTATTQQAFMSAQPVSRNVVAVNQKEVASAPVNAFTPPVAPSKQAVLGAGASAAAKPPAVLQGRAVVAKATPPPPPVPFVRQQQAIQANDGKPLAISQVRQIQPATTQSGHPIVKIAPPAKPVTPQNVQGGKPGQPQNSGSNQPGQTQTNTSNKPGTPNNAGQPGSAAANGGKPGQPQNSDSNQPGQTQANTGNKPGTPNNAGQPGSAATNGGKPGQPQNGGSNQPGQTQTNTGNKPGTPNNAGQPGSAVANGGNPNSNRRGFDDRPPTSRPNGGSSNSANTPNNSNPVHNQNSELDQKHQQELEQLRTKQDQDRQKLEQQQQQERQRLAQKNADDQKVQQLNQKHQEQLQTLEKQHDNQQQKLQQKQQDERKKAPPEKADHSHDKS